MNGVDRVDDASRVHRVDGVYRTRRLKSSAPGWSLDSGFRIACDVA